MKNVGIDWFELNQEEIVLYDHLLWQVPGVDRLVNVETRRVLRIRVHRTHLPLLPGNPQPEPGNTPAPTCIDPNWEWLRPYQQAAVQYVHGRVSTLLALDLGMGKTATATAAARLPALVLCPVSAIPVWQQEAERMGWSCFTATGMSKEELRKNYFDHYDLWIFPYSLALRYAGDWGGSAPETPKIHTLILDEFHVCTNRNVSWAKAVRKLARKQAIALTATPMRNKLASLWGLLDGLTPGAWGTLSQFRLRYCGAYQGAYALEDGHPTNQDELRKRLSAMVLKQTWADVGLDKVIPPLRRHIVEVEADHERIREVIENKASEGRRETIALMGAVRQEVGRQKLERLLAEDSLIGWQQTHGRVVYWVWHKALGQKVIRYLHEAMPGVPVDKLMGDSLTAERKRVVREWSQGDPACPRALVTTLGAGSTAISLTTARAVVFLEFAWDTLSQIQAEKRHHRFGQKHPKVWAYYCTLTETIDERILDVLLQKAQHSELALGEDGQTDLVEEIRGERPESWLSSLL